MSQWDTVSSVRDFASSKRPARSRGPGDLRLPVTHPRLEPCPSTPNCVCSEPPGSSIEPLAYSPEGREVSEQCLLELLGWKSEFGEIITDGNIWRTVATTRLLRFKDDVAFCFDDAAQVIHVRSASRVGRYDFGANRRRIERLRKAWVAMLHAVD